MSGSFACTTIVTPVTQSASSASSPLFPEADGEAILGRAVRLTEDGAWTIAEDRAPGCEVQVSRREAAFRVRRRVDMENLTALSGGFADLLSAEAKYGASDQIEIDIRNTAILSADIRGDCGEVVVDKIFLGSGKRQLVRTREAAAGLQARIGSFTPGLGHEEKNVVDDAIEWSDAQAYGFTFKAVEHAPALTLDVEMPRRIGEGEAISLAFETNRPARLVVFYVDQDQQGAVLWPSVDEPEPMAGPGAPAILPSAAERAAGIRLEAALAEPDRPARETLVVYAFETKADFDRVKPTPGTTSTAGAELAAELTRRVADIALSRWARASVHYVIEPRR